MIDLKRIQEQTKPLVNQGNNRTTTRIVIGMATCGISAGAKPVYQALIDEVHRWGLADVTVSPTGCIGACRLEPIVEVIRPGEEKVTYVEMTPEKAVKMVKEHLIEGKAVTEYTEDILDQQAKDNRIALRNCGVINPENIDEYIAREGYMALQKVLMEMTPNQVIDEIKKSGLRGRGGGGFPTGVKLEFAAKQINDQKYIICNADEGDPGAFMDRSVLEGDPHSVLEAMAINGYAIGANKGFIYVRAEYPVAVQRLGVAIKQAKEIGVLGKDIFGTGFDFDIELRLGAGAFVCGEETALIHSIEGKRGVPTLKPPFPAVSGLFGKPTVINNVETLANIAPIILKGADWFNKIGTEKSKGTKVFALGGKINHTGLVEVPMGITLREIIYEVGGGIPNGKRFKAVQTGGPSGGCIPPEHLDTQLDYDSLMALGSMMGSGGMIVMDEDTCMVDVARFYLEFTKDESCGKCTPCRIGTTRLLEILERITEGKGTMKDLDDLEFLSEQIKASSLCGLGQTAPNPILSTLKYFRDEYVAHIMDKKCPSGVCKSLIQYNIIQDACKGCGACTRVCPVNAISGRIKEPYKIDSDLCIKCGACYETCRFDAIEKQ